MEKRSDSPVAEKEMSLVRAFLSLFARIPERNENPQDLEAKLLLEYKNEKARQILEEIVRNLPE